MRTFSRTSLFGVLASLSAVILTPSRGDAQGVRLQRRRLTSQERHFLRSQPELPIAQPSGSAVEVERGIFHYRGTVRFKMSHRVVYGTAKSFMWTSGAVHIIGDFHSSYTYAPDLTNSQMSELTVG